MRCIKKCVGCKTDMFERLSFWTATHIRWANDSDYHELGGWWTMAYAQRRA